MKVETLKEGVHSGTASGIIPSSFRILRSLIERLENQETGYMDKALDVDIPPNRYKELYDLAAAKGQEAIRPYDVIGDLQNVSPNVLETLILNGWKAQLSVIGLDGLPNTIKAGNVLLPDCEARLSIRIPPIKNKDEARNFIVKALTENPPYQAKVTVSNVRAADGFNAPEYPELLESALHEASTAYYGKEKLAIAEGASIPFMGFLRDLWPSAQFVITGVLGPASNAHGPNEFMHIPFVKKLICCMAHVLAKTAGRLP